MLEAYSKLKWDYPNTRLLVVGPGLPDEGSFEVIGARSLQDVELIGGVSYEDLPRYYASADIFCSPATGAESFGIVLLEAMSAGKPLVASDIEGYRGIIEHGEQGLLVDPKDGDELAKSLARLIEDRELARRMGSRGREMVEQYRWEAVASQVEAYYEVCLRAANGTTRTRAV